MSDSNLSKQKESLEETTARIIREACAAIRKAVREAMRP